MLSLGMAPLRQRQEAASQPTMEQCQEGIQGLQTEREAVGPTLGEVRAEECGVL